MRNLVEVSTFTTPIPVPENGEPVAAEQRDPSLQAFANRTKYLKDHVDPIEARIVVDEWTYPAPKARTIVFVGAEVFSAGADGTAGWRLSGSILVSRVDDAQLYFPLRLPHGATLTRVRAMVKPGAARSGGPPSMLVTMSVRDFSVDFGAPGAGSSNILATDSDDGTTNWQLLDSGVLAVSIASQTGYGVQIQGGDDGGVHVDDTLNAIEIQFTDPGPRNF